MADKAGPAPRHEHVHNAMQAHQHVGRRMIGGGDGADAAGRHAGGHGGGVKHLGDGDAGALRKRPSAQHDGVARLQADARGVGGDVRARLVDDGDDAEGDADALKLDARFERAALLHDVDRVGQRHQILERRSHRLDAIGIEHQPIEQAFLHLRGTRRFHVLIVCGKDFRRVCTQGGRHRAQGVVALLRRRLGKRTARHLRGLSDAAHLIFKLHVPPFIETD